ncbi:6927_t:CDS:2 [Entrophospora sp. SA101]|nr:6927_t:CDS:2 [Entrophospora sp. SA101]
MVIKFINVFLFRCETDLKWYKCGPLSNRIITGCAIGIVTPIIQCALQNNPSLTNYHSIYKDLNFGSWAGRLGEIATEEYLVRSLHGLPELAPIIGVSQKEYKQILDNRLMEVGVIPTIPAELEAYGGILPEQLMN